MNPLESNSTAFNEVTSLLPPPFRTLFLKVVDAVKGALHATLVDTLVGEFHEKFITMWHHPGDRAAARALRQCERMHRESAIKILQEVLVAELTLLAKAMVDAFKTNGSTQDLLPDSMLEILESKITALEEKVSSIESLKE